jgi:ATP-dependent RNA helicase DHX36
VASERAEELGVSVGYQIRLEKVAPRKVGCINFCTTGVLMKFMEIDPALNDYSHIIIDEIHERNVQTDICLALIKQIVRYRKNLKIILMSATLNAESFSQYFNDCPKIHIEGFTHAVQDLYLEDVLEETGFNNFQRPRKEPVWVQHKMHNKRRADDFEVIVGNYASSLRGRYSQSTINCLLNPQTEFIDPGFIETLIHHISYNKPAGAILVILPGYSVISKLFENLQASPQFPSSKFVIYPLHSLLTGSDQRSIFIRPPEGVRKIILATPLAETSITIDDVVYVINAGKMRKPSFDFDRNAKVLEDQWITKANETQRRGRAGRVQPGVCYHLYSRARSNSLEAFEQPEILRIRLEEVLLTIKVLCIKNIKPFLSTLIDIPTDKAVDPSINLLQRLGALTDNEELTPLGLHLARLAVHPQIGKMLLFSSIFSCFDPISSVAAALSFKSPFYNVMGKEDQCNNAKRRFSNDSDQLAAANAMKEWKEVQHDLRGFCYRNFLSHSTLMMLDRMKSQFTQSLYQSKFLGDNRSDDDDNNFHSENIDVLRAVICGGLYPNIAYRFMRISRNKRIERIKSGGKTVKLIPSSVNCDDGSVYDPGYMVFHELQKFTGGFFVMETTANVGPYAILMFGDRIAPETISDTHFISVSDIVKFRCNQQTAQLIIDLRDCLNQLLEKKIAEPSPTAWDSDEGKVLKAIVELISVTSSSFKDFEQDDDDD